jgi:hypothetical protein
VSYGACAVDGTGDSAGPAGGNPMDLFPNANFSFEEIRKRGLNYVDKTEHALRLLTDYNDTTSFLLSRPRRFGKSLFLSTL